MNDFISNHWQLNTIFNTFFYVLCIKIHNLKLVFALTWFQAIIASIKSFNISTEQLNCTQTDSLLTFMNGEIVHHYDTNDKKHCF